MMSRGSLPCSLSISHLFCIGFLINLRSFQKDVFREIGSLKENEGEEFYFRVYDDLV